MQGFNLAFQTVDKVTVDSLFKMLIINIVFGINSIRKTCQEIEVNLADISKLENGTRNPSINLLKRLAEGMGMTVKIEFVPKH